MLEKNDRARGECKCVCMCDMLDIGNGRGGLHIVRLKELLCVCALLGLSGKNYARGCAYLCILYV